MKKAFFILLLGAFLFSIGCSSAEHRRVHRASMQKDFQNMHKFVDRYFWDYDWDTDPHYHP